MQLAQFTGLGLVVIGGLLTVLLRSEADGGMHTAAAQSLAGVVVGLLGAFAILMWTTDLIPDDFEWIGVVAVAVGAAVLVVIIRLRSSA